MSKVKRFKCQCDGTWYRVRVNWRDALAEPCFSCGRWVTPELADCPDKLVKRAWYYRRKKDGLLLFERHHGIDEATEVILTLGGYDDVEERRCVCRWKTLSKCELCNGLGWFLIYRVVLDSPQNGEKG